MIYFFILIQFTIICTDHNVKMIVHKYIEIAKMIVHKYMYIEIAKMIVHKYTCILKWQLSQKFLDLQY